MARTPRRWKDGEFKSILINPAAGVAEVVDFGTDLGPDRVLVTLDNLVTSEYRFYWRTSDDPADLDLDIPSPELGTMMIKGIGCRVLPGAGDVVLEQTEGHRFWILVFVSDPGAELIVEGGISAAPNQ